MGEVSKKTHTRLRNNHHNEYDDWWNSVHMLRCDTEDFAAGRTYSPYTQNRLSRTPLLKRALHIVASGLRLMRNDLVHDKDHWEHLMLRTLQSYVTIRDKRWRFTVRDPTKEEVDEIMELAEKNLRARRPDRVNELSNRQCESRRRTKPLVQEAGKGSEK